MPTPEEDASARGLVGGREAGEDHVEDIIGEVSDAIRHAACVDLIDGHWSIDM